MTTSPSSGTGTAPDPPDFDGMAHLFAAFTEVWDGIDRGAFSAWVGRQLGAGARAADLGCGAGRHLPLLAERYDAVLAVDVSRAILGLAVRRHAQPGITFRRADLLDLDPARDGTFDAVLAVNALHHAGPAEVVLPRVRDLVAPGGVLVAVDMVDPGDWTSPGWHVDRAFADARAAWELTGDADRATAVLRQLLDPGWLAMGLRDTPLRREEFHAAYRAVFPGASFADDLHPLMCGATWRRPAS